MPGGWGQALVSGAQRQGTGQQAQTEAEEVLSEHEEELLHSEGDRELEYIFQYVMIQRLKNILARR